MAADLTPSMALRRAASNELKRLDRTEARLEQRRQRLAREIDQIDQQLSRVQEQRKRLHELGLNPEGLGAGSALTSARPRLRGAEIRERAARAVFIAHGVDTELHYRRWFELLLEEGVEVAGKDPLATFLTNLSRSPAVRRGEAPGTYAIDSGADERLRSRLREAEAELGDLQAQIGRPGISTVGLRDHRDQLLGEIKRLNSQIAEVERILTPAPKQLAPSAEAA